MIHMIACFPVITLFTQLEHSVTEIPDWGLWKVNKQNCFCGTNSSSVSRCTYLDAIMDTSAIVSMSISVCICVNEWKYIYVCVCVCVCAHSVMVTVTENEQLPQVKILDEIVCISHSANTLGKGMNQTILYPIYGGCRIHWLLLCKGVRLPLTSVLEMTLNNLMMRFK